MELRKDTNLTLTAAVDRTPFAKVDGTPMNNVSDFAKVLDYIGQRCYKFEFKLSLKFTERSYELRCLGTLVSHSWAERPA